MRVFHKEDDILLDTFQLGANELIRDRLMKELYLRFTEQNDAEACFALSLYNCVLVPLIRDGQKQHKYLIDTIEWSTKAVEIDNEHWPSLFLRSMLRLMMNDESDEMAMYLLPMDYIEQDAVEDLFRMIDLQNQYIPSSPYCIIPYIQLAYVEMMEEEADKSFAILKDAEKKVKFGKLTYFNRVLRLPFVSIYNRAYGLHHKETIELLRQWMKIFFPDQSSKEKIQ